MEFSELKNKALTVQNHYQKVNKRKGEKRWTYQEYAQGLVGDVGDLTKMLMAKANFREYKGDLDNDIQHELSDCLWAILTISNELNIDIEKEFLSQMDSLIKRIEE